MLRRRRNILLFGQKKPFNKFSMLFDGVDEFVNIDGVRTSLASTTKGTWCCWVKPVDATPATSDRLIAFGDTNAAEFILTQNRTDGDFLGQCKIAGTNKWAFATDVVPFSDNTWTHWAMIQDGTAPVLYIDGQLVDITFSITTDKAAWINDATGLDNGRIASLNQNSAGESNTYNGNIDEVGFFNTDLSSAEVSEIYNGGKPKDLTKHTKVDNLIAYYRMGDKSEFSTNHFFPEIKSGLNNFKSTLFDGVDEFVNIDDVQTALASTTKGTFSCWVKPVDATPAAADVILSFGDTNANEFIDLFINTNGTLSSQLRSSVETKWVIATDSAFGSDNTWTHIAIVQSGESRLYVDGTDVAQAFSNTTDKSQWFNSLSGLDNGRIASFNKNNGGETNHFNGNVDEVSFWDTDLSPGAISDIYNNGSPTDLTTYSAASANLVSYFRMGDKSTFDGTDHTFPDQKGSNDGSSVNMEDADVEFDVPLLGASVNMEENDKELDVPK